MLAIVYAQNEPFATQQKTYCQQPKSEQLIKASAGWGCILLLSLGVQHSDGFGVYSYFDNYITKLRMS